MLKPGQVIVRQMWQEGSITRGAVGYGLGKLVTRYLEEAGMVAADNLNPQKARILLMLSLTRSQDISEIRRIFATY